MLSLWGNKERVARGEQNRGPLNTQYLEWGAHMCLKDCSWDRVSKQSIAPSTTSAVVRAYERKLCNQNLVSDPGSNSYLNEPE